MINIIVCSFFKQLFIGIFVSGAASILVALVGWNYFLIRNVAFTLQEIQLGKEAIDVLGGFDINIPKEAVRLFFYIYFIIAISFLLEFKNQNYKYRLVSASIGILSI